MSPFATFFLGLGIFFVVTVSASRAEGCLFLTLHSGKPTAEILAMMDVLKSRPGGSRGTNVLHSLLTRATKSESRQRDDSGLLPLFSRGILLKGPGSSGEKSHALTFYGEGLPLLGESIVMIASDTPEGTSTVAVSLTLYGIGHLNTLDGTTITTSGIISPDMGSPEPEKPPPFDLHKARGTAIQFLALTFTLIPVILGLLNVGDRDFWALLSVKFFVIFIAIVPLSIYSYTHYNATWHPIIEGLVLVTLGAGVGCLVAGAFVRGKLA